MISNHLESFENFMHFILNLIYYFNVILKLIINYFVFLINFNFILKILKVKIYRLIVIYFDLFKILLIKIHHLAGHHHP